MMNLAFTVGTYGDFNWEAVYARNADEAKGLWLKDHPADYRQFVKMRREELAAVDAERARYLDVLSNKAVLVQPMDMGAFRHAAGEGKRP
jgi:hypothetical protein